MQWGRENFWIDGAIAPLSGDHCLHEYPKLNGECFQEFLDWLSQELGEDWAILQMDQAPAPRTSAIRCPENVIPLVQPAHSPELNPIERFWQLLKRSLKNQIFPSLQALRERVQELFDQLTLEQVMSVSSYNFILEALLYVASHSIGITLEIPGTGQRLGFTSSEALMDTLERKLSQNLSEKRHPDV